MFEDEQILEVQLLERDSLQAQGIVSLEVSVDIHPMDFEQEPKTQAYTKAPAMADSLTLAMEDRIEEAELYNSQIFKEFHIALVMIHMKLPKVGQEEAQRFKLMSSNTATAIDLFTSSLFMHLRLKSILAFRELDFNSDLLRTSDQFTVLLTSLPLFMLASNFSPVAKYTNQLTESPLQPIEIEFKYHSIKQQLFFCQLHQLLDILKVLVRQITATDLTTVG